MDNSKMRRISLLLAAIFGVIGIPVSAADIADGSYYIVGKDSHKALSAAEEEDGNILLEQSSRRAGDLGQLWTLKRIEGNGGSTFEIRSKKYGFYLAAGEENEDGDVSVVLVEESENAPYWTLQRYLNSYAVEYSDSGTALNITGSSHSDDAPIILYEVSLDDNAQWLLFPADNRGSAAPPDGEVSQFNNGTMQYQLAASRSARLESDRLRRMKLMDYQPSGVFIEEGESVSVTVQGLSSSPDGLTIMVGPMNGFFEENSENDPQNILASEGRNDFVATRSGPIYFLYTDSGFNDVALPTIDVTITEGGYPFPLYIKGQTHFEEWQQILEESAGAPIVEMMSDRVLITTMSETYANSPQGDPEDILNTLEQIIGWYDDFSGLDGSSDIDQPSSLRLHYQQDTVTPRRVFDDGVYMYATDYFVGVPGQNMGDLLDVEKLRHAWSIWHETGHMYQQSDWTWEKIVETTVNIYSLSAQAHFGYRSNLKIVDPDTRKSPIDLAKMYLSRKRRDFDSDRQMRFSDDDDSDLWVRLVMFDQLHVGLGADFYPLLHKYYRANPLDDSVAQDPAAQLQTFILRSSIIASEDLTKFFNDWGIKVENETAEQLQELNLPFADSDLSSVELR